MTTTGKSLLLAFALALMILQPVSGHAAAAGTELYLPSVARSPGASGSFWYSTVWIHNAGDDPAHLTLSFLRRGRPNLAPEEQLMTVEPGRTITVGDVLWDLFGVEEGAGALRVSSDVQVVVSARVYNLPGTQIAESQGQFFAGLPAELAVVMGESTDIPGVTQPADETFRCNFGLVETRGESAVVRVVLVSPDGVDQAARTYNIRPYEALQKGLSDLGGDVIVDGGRLNVTVNSGTGAVLAFASIIGNGFFSQDPSTLEMEFDLDVTAPGDGITGVSAGSGLVGGGSEGEVSLAVGAGSGIEVLEDAVGIADGGVTRTMIGGGELLTGLSVSGQTLHDDVQLVAGENVTLSVTGQSVEVSAAGGGTGGGISSVAAGPGLVGGGNSGAVSLAVGAGNGIAVHQDAVAIADGGVTGAMIADDEVVKGLSVSGQTLHDGITLVAGDNITLSVNDQSVEISSNGGGGGGGTGGTAETQYELEVTTSTGAWTTERAVGVPYQTSDGAWRFRFNVWGRTWSLENDVTIIFDGLVFKNVAGYEQAVTINLTSVAGIAYAVPGTGNVEVVVPTGTGRTRFNIAGDLELDGRPSFAE